MFSWGGGLAIPSPAIDTDKERTPPSPATPLDFPAYVPEKLHSYEDDPDCDKLVRLLSILKRPQDVSAEYFNAFNLTVETNVPPTELLDGLGSLPPYQWPEQSEVDGGGKSLMSNGSPFPDKEKYEMLRRELLYDNDDAFRALSRIDPLPGHEKIRLTHARKFWCGLEHVAQYWDSSLDQYTEYDDDELPIPTRMATDCEMNDADERPAPRAVDGMDIDSEGGGHEASQTAKRKGAGSRVMYKGRRIGAGKDMPDSIREEMMRGFVEMVAWQFGCQTTIPTLPPRLFVKGLLFPVRQSVVVGRVPRDREAARMRRLEGPVLLVQCRGDTQFRRGDGGGRYGEMCDVLRETAAMLLLAQERGREGAVEAKPGAGKWWTTEPRWGGAVDHGMAEEPEQQEAVSGGDERDDRRAAGLGRRRPPGLRAGGLKKRRTRSEQWKLVQPGPSLWDRRMDYRRIGRGRDTGFDDIFLVSSINHHFAIVRLRVHGRYLGWLQTGDGKADADAEAEVDDGQAWRRLAMRRTRWFDMLEASDRAAGLEALWAVFAHLLRRT